MTTPFTPFLEDLSLRRPLTRHSFGAHAASSTPPVVCGVRSAVRRRRRRGSTARACRCGAASSASGRRTAPGGRRAGGRRPRARPRTRLWRPDEDPQPHDAPHAAHRRAPAVVSAKRLFATTTVRRVTSCRVPSAKVRSSSTWRPFARPTVFRPRPPRNENGARRSIHSTRPVPGDLRPRHLRSGVRRGHGDAASASAHATSAMKTTADVHETRATRGRRVSCSPGIGSRRASLTLPLYGAYDGD